jgi:pimeloyl-ACP methyl ester carboxylesterase
MSVGAVVIAGLQVRWSWERTWLPRWLAQVGRPAADRREIIPGIVGRGHGKERPPPAVGAGLPVLFVHGFAGDKRTFDRVVPLGAGTFDCVVVDPPGLS